MGYYTNYTIEIDSKQAQVPSCKHKPKDVKFCPECGVAVGMVDLYDNVIKHLEENYSDDYDLASIVDNSSEGWKSEGWKWYDHEKTMREISTKFPSVIFTLIGEGEESGDMWRKYFKNGKMQIAKAVMIHFESYDEELLK